jgi:O-antigen/teichoic acid export membrane protein
MDTLLIRSVAVYRARRQWPLLKGVMGFAGRVVLAVSAALVILAATAGWLLVGDAGNSALRAFWIALLAVPVVALNECRQGILRALDRVILGQIPDLLVRPGALLLLVGLAWVLTDALTPEVGVGLAVLAYVIAFLIGAVWLLREVPAEVRTARREIDRKAWLLAALPMLFLAGMQVVNQQTDVLMLGSIMGTKAAGIYSVASQGAGFVMFVLIAVNSALAPTLAALHAREERSRLQYVVTRAARVTLLGCFLVAATLVLLSRVYLGLFGEAFLSGNTALTILAAGSVLNVALIWAGVLLVMTGYERLAAKGIGLTAVLNVVLNAALIPRYGLTGAAIATATSTAIGNGLLVFLVIRRLRIDPTALGLGRDRSSV